MITQILPETNVLQREYLWQAPWQALCEYQDRVADFWRMSFRGWSFFLPFVGTEKTDPALAQKEWSGDSERPDVKPEGNTSPEIEKPRQETIKQAQGESQPPNGKPTRKRAAQQPAGAKKQPERTGRASPAVLAGLRHRSYSVKLAAVSAMTTNQKLRTQEAIPLLQRIVDNQTIRSRDPELRAAAKKVLQQSRQEIGRQSSQATAKRSPAKPKSRRRTATV